MAKPKVFYRALNNFDYDDNSDECTVKDFGPSLTVQSMAEEVDLNVIMERFGITGKMPENAALLTYGDFDGIFDFRSGQDAILRAKNLFNDMPAKVRARFQNDPQLFLEFCEEPENIDEMVKLGLAVKKGEPVVPGTDSSARGQAQAAGNSPAKDQGGPTGSSGGSGGSGQPSRAGSASGEG